MSAGGITYRGDVSVEDSVTNPRVNGISWSDMLKVSSNDVISGSYHFDQATVTTAMNSGNINGLDLSQDAVLITGDQVIDGKFVLLIIVFCRVGGIGLRFLLLFKKSLLLFFRLTCYIHVI